MNDIAIYGAGGLGREIACVIKRINEASDEVVWNLIGFFDDGLEKGIKNEYGEILGDMDDLKSIDVPISIIIGIASPRIIEKIVTSLEGCANIDYPNIIAPDLDCFDYSNYKLGKGNFINLRCLLSINTSLGSFNSLGCGVAIGHDAVIGNYNVFMPSVQICGYTHIGKSNFFGLSSIILQGLTVNENVTVGASSILMKDATDNTIMFGNPARPMTKKA